MSSPSERFTSIDVLHTTNTAVGVYGSSVMSITENGIRTPLYTAKMKSNVSFTPSKILLDNAGRSLFAITPDKRNLLCQLDTETGTNVQEFDVKLVHASVPGSLDTVVTYQKFASTKSHTDCSFVGVSGNSIVKLNWDPRQKQSRDYVIKKNHAFIKASRGFRFTCCATTSEGHIAAGANDGSIRLLKNGQSLKIPKTMLTIFADPVKGIDVSGDGEWVVWTTKTYLAVFNTKWTDSRGTRSGFSEPMPPKERRVLTLKIPQKYQTTYDITRVSLTPARFDNGPYSGVKNIIEQDIVTSTGPFVIRYKMRLVKADYLSTGCSQSRAHPVIYRQQDKIYDKTFGYANNSLFTAFRSDVKSISFNDEDDDGVDDEDDYDYDPLKEDITLDYPDTPLPLTGDGKPRAYHFTSPTQLDSRDDIRPVRTSSVTVTVTAPATGIDTHATDTPSTTYTPTPISTDTVTTTPTTSDVTSPLHRQASVSFTESDSDSDSDDNETSDCALGHVSDDDIQVVFDSDSDSYDKAIPVNNTNITPPDNSESGGVITQAVNSCDEIISSSNTPNNCDSDSSCLTETTGDSDVSPHTTVVVGVEGGVVVSPLKNKDICSVDVIENIDAQIEKIDFTQMLDLNTTLVTQ